MKYYKILSEDETHHDLKYKYGLNVDPVPFNPTGSCRAGGIYFSREDILAFLDYESWIREVRIPVDAQVYEDPDPDPKKWKADKVWLGRKRRITAKVIAELIQAGANIHAHINQALYWANKYGHIEVVKLLLKAGADVHAYDDEALRWASVGGHTEIVQLLLKAGANVHACNDEALYWANKRGHTEVVELLTQWKGRK